MRIPTVVLRNKQTGKRIVVNEIDWAQDLGRGEYRNYERVGERHTGREEDKLILNDTPQAEPEKAEEPEEQETDPMSAALDDAESKPRTGRGRGRGRRNTS